MRVVICSDFHLDKNNRLNDVIKSMKQILKFAIKNKVQYLIFGGDMYQRRRPAQIEMRVAERWIKRLVDNNIKVILVVGNHDQDESTNTLAEFKTLDISNVKVVKSPYIFEKWLYISHELLKESEMGPLSYKLPSSNSLTVKELIEQNKDVRVFALGHIHKFQILNKKPLVYHIGSPERINFGERGEKKYFTYINDSKIKFIQLYIRPMIQVDIDANNVTFPMSIENGSIVKVVIHGTKREIREKWDERKALETIKKDTVGKNLHSISFVYDIKPSDDVMNSNINEQNSPLKCFLNYAKEKNFDKETIDLGREIIGEI